MISAISSIRLGHRKKSICGSLTDIMNPKKAIFFTPSDSSGNIKGPKWCLKHKLVCMNTIPAPAFQNSIACEDYVVIKSGADRYKDLFLDPLPEVPNYVAAPLPLKSFSVSKSMSEIASSDQRFYKESPLSEYSYKPTNIKEGKINESDSDSSEEIDPKIYNNPPPPLKLLKNLPVMKVH